MWQQIPEQCDTAGACSSLQGTQVTLRSVGSLQECLLLTLAKALTMKLTATIVLLIAVILSTFNLASASAPCVDTAASQVEVSIIKHGDSERCGVGIVIFGVGGSLIGSKCSEHETRTPAHQACEGEVNAGTKCVPETSLAVETRDCKCGGLVIPWIEIGIPTTCVCGDWTNSGTVEDMKTALCNG